MASTSGTGIPLEFQISQARPPSPNADDIEPVPMFSDTQSFVVIRSAGDFDDLSDDNVIADMSLLRDHKRILHEELAEMEKSSKTQPPTPFASVVSQPENPVNKSLEASASGPLSTSLTALSLPKDIGQASPDENELAAISILSFAPSDFGSEEIQTKVSQLIEENTKLKETIIQNNKAMTTQYERIVAWKENVERVHEHHKLKFRDAKKCIETLKGENAALKADKENLLMTLDHQRSELDKTKQLLTVAAADKPSLSEVDVAKIQIADLEGMVGQLVANNEQLGLELKEAKREVKKIRAEKVRLENEKAHLKLELDIEDATAWQRRELDKTSKLLEECAEKNMRDFKLDTAKQSIEELEKRIETMTLAHKQEIEGEKSEKCAIMKKLERYEMELEKSYKVLKDVQKLSMDTQIDEENFKLAHEKLLMSEFNYEQLEKQMAKAQASLDSAVAERNSLIFEIERRDQQLVDANLKYIKLEETVAEKQEIIKSHEDAIRGLREADELAKIDAWKSRQKCFELEQKLVAYQSDPKRCVTSQNSSDNTELAFTRQQLVQLQKTLTECDQNRAVANARAEQLSNDNAALRKQLEDGNSDGDDTFALKTQLDLYKADFEAEHQAKEDMKREKNKMAEDLQLLHRRNQQLQEEIELLRGQLTRQGMTPQRRDAQGDPPARAPYSYKCPKCNFGFDTETAIMNHIERCIELEDNIP